MKKITRFFSLVMLAMLSFVAASAQVQPVVGYNEYGFKTASGNRWLSGYLLDETRLTYGQFSSSNTNANLVRLVSTGVDGQFKLRATKNNGSYTSNFSSAIANGRFVGLEDAEPADGGKLIFTTEDNAATWTLESGDAENTYRLILAGTSYQMQVASANASGDMIISSTTNATNGDFYFYTLVDASNYMGDQVIGLMNEADVTWGSISEDFTTTTFLDFLYLPTGKYRIKSANTTTSNPTFSAYAVCDFPRVWGTAKTLGIATTEADSINKNNYIWQVTRDGYSKTFSLLGGDGAAMNNGSDQTTLTLRNSNYYGNASYKGILNFSNGIHLSGQSHLTVNGTANSSAEATLTNPFTMTSWNSVSDICSHFYFEPVTDRDFYSVSLSVASGASVERPVIVYDGQYSTNNGFFSVATGTTISKDDLSAYGDRGAIQEVTIDNDAKTIVAVIGTASIETQYENAVGAIRTQLEAYTAGTGAIDVNEDKLSAAKTAFEAKVTELGTATSTEEYTTYLAALNEIAQKTNLINGFNGGEVIRLRSVSSSNYYAAYSSYTTPAANFTAREANFTEFVVTKNEDGTYGLRPLGAASFYMQIPAGANVTFSTDATALKLYAFDGTNAYFTFQHEANGETAYLSANGNIQGLATSEGKSQWYYQSVSDSYSTYINDLLSTYSTYLSNIGGDNVIQCSEAKEPAATVKSYVAAASTDLVTLSGYYVSGLSLYSATYTPNISTEGTNVTFLNNYYPTYYLGLDASTGATLSGITDKALRDVWTITRNTNNTYYIKNYLTGKYLQAASESAQIQLGDEPVAYYLYVADGANGVGSFSSTNSTSQNTGIHRAGGGAIVGWKVTAAASQWVITEVSTDDLVSGDLVTNEATLSQNTASGNAAIIKMLGTSVEASTEVNDITDVQQVRQAYYDALAEAGNYYYRISTAGANQYTGRSMAFVTKSSGDIVPAFTETSDAAIDQLWQLKQVSESSMQFYLENANRAAAGLAAQVSTPVSGGDTATPFAETGAQYYFTLVSDGVIQLTSASGNKINVETAARDYHISAWYQNNSQLTIAKVESVDFTTASTPSGNLATIYLPFTAEFPDGVTAYVTTTLDDDNNLGISAADIVTAKNGAILVSDEATTYKIAISENSGETSTLTGTTVTQNASDVTEGTPLIFAIGTNSRVAGFYNPSATTLKANRAYYVAANGESAVKIAFPGDVTGISTVATDDADASATTFDLQGRRVQSAQKGVYIRDGKKVIVK